MTTRTTLGANFGGGNTFTRDIANSNYNAFQATVGRKATDVTFLAAYTFSRAIDDASAFGDLINFTNFRLSRALSSYDLTHNFVASYNWAIPFDRAFSALPKRLTQGWNINGISRFSTGFPIFIHQSAGDASLVGSSSTDEPNLRARLSSRTRVPMPTATTFCPPLSAQTRFSELSGPPTGPGILNTDFGLSKRIPIKGSVALELRSEFFNIFNHTQFNNLTGNISSGTFGAVTTARDPRIGQVSAKLYW